MTGKTFHNYNYFLNGHPPEDELVKLALADVKKSELSAAILEQNGVKIFNGTQEERNKCLGSSLNGQKSLCVLFPYYTDTGEPPLCRVKLIPSYIDKNGKELKYLQPKGTGNHLYIPKSVCPILQDPSIPLLITEGEKKALKATQEGLSCIGLSGLWSWSDGNKGLIEDFDKINFQGRKVSIVPDNDWQEPNKYGYSKNLEQAVEQLGQKLIDRGAIVDIVEIVDISGKMLGFDKKEGMKVKIGLDDFLCHYSSDDFKRLPVIELGQEEKEKPKSDLDLIPPCDFPFEIFPSALREEIFLVAKAINVDPEFVAMGMLTVFSGAIGNTLRIQAKRGHVVAPFLWSIVIAETGYGKTPTMNVLLEHIRAKEAEAAMRYEEAMKLYKVSLREAKRAKKGKE